MNKKWLKRRKRIFDVIEVGSDFDFISRSYDMVNISAIIINLLVSILGTYAEIRESYGTLLVILEGISVAFFAVDYILRLWTAKFLYPELGEMHAIKKYMFSFTGLVDVLSFLPYYLPVFFPTGTVAFRLIRIVRIFRLFRINAYYDSLNVITEVINGKRQQLISSVFIILTLMLASSLCMYSIEHEAQPEVFKSAFSGIWWATSTLLTVGYGDIYPVTALGKLLGICIAFLGVGMVAIPTGIISAGFVEQYSDIKKRAEYGYEKDMNFIKVHLDESDSWVGKSIAELRMPKGMIIAAVKRNKQVIIPRGDVQLLENDTVILGAEPYGDQDKMQLKEIVLKEANPWVGMKLKDLDISRHSIIVLVKRKNKALIPYGRLRLEENDRVFLYTKKYRHSARNVEL